MPRKKPEPERSAADMMELAIQKRDQEQALLLVKRRVGEQFAAILAKNRIGAGNRSAVPVTLSPVSVSLLGELTALLGVSRGRVIDELLESVAGVVADQKQRLADRKAASWDDDEFIEDVMKGRAEK